MTDSAAMPQLLLSIPADLDEIFRLYQLASAYQIAVKGAVVWPEFDQGMVAQEVAEGRQWKLLLGDTIACVWAITFDDLAIWGPRNADPAVYLHRIATNPTCRGRGMVATIVAWAKAYARQHQKKYVRLDTVGENHGLIAHYTKRLYLPRAD